MKLNVVMVDDARYPSNGLSSFIGHKKDHLRMGTERVVWAKF
jgi:hypothetical protein